MFDVAWSALPYLLTATVQTLLIAGGGVAGGLLLGLFFGIASDMAPAPVRWVITAYVFIVRGIPVLIWMFLAYFALPAFGVEISSMVTVTGALAVYAAAFFTEITRGAIQAVPRGQIEAALGLGMRRLVCLRLVVLPQAIKLSIPPLLSNSVIIVKQSSYVSVVGVWELTYASREVVQRTLEPFQVFVVAMAIYFLICYPMSIIAQRMEKRYAYES